VSLVADAIRDVTRRNDIVLDAFSGSGTTIMACAKVGRRGYAVELDPHYVDVAVRRWQDWSGCEARHAQTGLTFAETEEARRASPAGAPLEHQPIEDPLPGDQLAESPDLQQTPEPLVVRHRVRRAA
jgi:hypothetical protein